MKIVPQSFEPIINSGDHVANIAAAARICYKSEGKALADETPFVNGLVKGKHNSTLEMSVLHLKINCHTPEDVCQLLDSNFIICDFVKTDSFMYCTASIRSWREFVLSRGNGKFIQSICYILKTILPEVFTNDLPKAESNHAIIEFDPRTLPTDIAKYHIHQGIKFITNRAVTHEFVRHRPCSFLQESQRYCMYSKEQFGNEVTFIEPKPFYTVEHDHYNVWKGLCESAEESYLWLLKKGSSPQAARTVLPNSCKTELIIYCSLHEWTHIFAMRDSSKAEPSMREAIEPVTAWFIENWGDYFPHNLWERSVG